MADRTATVETARSAERQVFPKNAVERVEVWAEPYRGQELVQARVHYQDPDTGEWRPTKKGLSLSPELAAQVAAAMADRARALLGD